MPTLDITHLRLQNQRLSESEFRKPVEVVKWLGAVQAQDYLGAKWAVGQRMRAGSDEAIEKAFADGEILRTHVMRPTWHFVTPADIRWLLKLTAPRVNAASAYYYRKYELDDAVFARSNKAITNALRGCRQLTRGELRPAVNRAGVAVEDSLRFNLILLRAELDGVICSGARRGKQFTYALLDERVPGTQALSRNEALVELTRRYFTSHGPATLQDFAWWSGLAIGDVRRGLEMAQHHLAKAEIEGKTYWLPRSMTATRRLRRLANLLPTYDEYLVAYKDRSAALDSNQTPPANVVFSSAIVVGGRVVGSWERAFKKNSVIISLSPFSSFSKAETLAISKAIRRYAAFLGLTAVLS